MARKQRYAILLEKLRRGETLSASEIGELEGFEVERKPKKNRKNNRAAEASTKAMSPVELARKQRHLHLLRKLKTGKGLAPREQKELGSYRNIQVRPAVYDGRNDHAALMRQRRAEARLIIIPEPKNWNRRRKCLADPERFCRTYWPHIFYNPFARSQKLILSSIVERLGSSGNTAEAVPRGDGKSNITICVGGIWGPCKGIVSYLVIICGNGELAVRELKNTKRMYEFSNDFADDFPEVCFPIRRLEGSTQRARTQTAKMEGSPYDPERTLLTWETDTLVLPTVRLSDGKYAKTSGTTIVAKGPDAAFRGLVENGTRPDLIVLDDIETRESAFSEKQVSDRMSLIRQDIMNLSGPNDPMPILVLGSIITSGCLMDKLTDRELHPEWGGVRLKRVLEWPTHSELWEKYIELRKADQRSGDSSGRMAHRYYLENREAMDQGVETSNPYRFKGVKLPDGSLLEVSAIQSAYNDLSDIGQEAFDAEHQASPHKDEREEGNILDVSQVMRKLNRVPKGFVPEGTEAVTIGIDVGARLLHWVAIGWKRGLIGNIFDYGDEPVNSPLDKNLQSEDAKVEVEKAIFNALVSFRDWEMANGWKVQGSDKISHADLITIDTGYMDSAVYAYLRSGKGRGCYAVAGYGSTQRRSYPNPNSAKLKRIGIHWWASYLQDKRSWLHHVDSDYWKLHVQTGFMLQPLKDGSLSLFGDNPVTHSMFAKQICAEKWVEEFIPGKGIHRYFRQEYRHNHYLDSVHYATVGASMLGLGDEKQPRKQPTQDAPVLQDNLGSVPIRTSY